MIEAEKAIYTVTRMCGYSEFRSGVGFIVGCVVEVEFDIRGGTVPSRLARRGRTGWSRTETLWQLPRDGTRGLPGVVPEATSEPVRRARSGGRSIEHVLDHAVADDQSQPLVERQPTCLERRQAQFLRQAPVSVREYLKRQVKPLNDLTLVVGVLAGQAENPSAPAARRSW